MIQHCSILYNDDDEMDQWRVYNELVQEDQKDWKIIHVDLIELNE